MSGTSEIITRADAPDPQFSREVMAAHFHSVRDSVLSAAPLAINGALVLTFAGRLRPVGQSRAATAVVRGGVLTADRRPERRS